MTFDIGASDGLKIFTNNSDDIFNIDSDLGPNFLIEQGPTVNVVNTGKIDNLSSGITIDFPNESPIDFVGSTHHPPRQRIESNTSNVTIEAEPVTTRPSLINNNSTTRQNTSKKHHRPSSHSNHTDTHTDTHNHTNTDTHTNTDNNEATEINLGFDDLLDNRKLKIDNGGTMNAHTIINDAASQDSQSTIRQPEYTPPSSPVPTPTSRPRRNHESRESREVKQETFEPQPSRYVSEDDEKMDLLLKLKALEARRGITLSKVYNAKSSLEEIRMEYKNQMNVLDTEANIKFMRKGLIFCTSGIEYVNRKFDPLGAKLDGWSESLMESVSDFDGIFERLSNKYSGSFQMEPEYELLFALGGSAFLFHLSNTLFKTGMPQFGNVLRENPDVFNGIIGVAKEAQRRSQQVPMPSNASTSADMPGPGLDLNDLLQKMGMNGGGMNGFAQSMNKPLAQPQATRDFKDPPMNDLFRKMMEQSQTQNDDILSVSSNDSDRMIGHGSTRAIISPLPASKKGGSSGNIIKF